MNFLDLRNRNVTLFRSDLAGNDDTLSPNYREITFLKVKYFNEAWQEDIFTVYICGFSFFFFILNKVAFILYLILFCSSVHYEYILCINENTL